MRRRARGLRFRGEYGNLSEERELRRQKEQLPSSQLAFMLLFPRYFIF
jgi:hypothetical protein